MKKYFIGLAAVVAIALFSAFTLDNKKADPVLFFYEVDGSGEINPSNPLNEEAMTVEEFELINPLDCDLVDQRDCVRAWEVGHTPTTTGTDFDYRIRKSI